MFVQFTLALFSQLYKRTSVSREYVSTEFDCL